MNNKRMKKSIFDTNARFARSHISTAIKAALLVPGMIGMTANANATLPVEAAGDSRFNIQSIDTDANSVIVTQNQQVAWVKWDTYNIGAGNTVAYDYTEGGNAFHALNFVLGTQISDIQGNITSDGNVYLFNANGIVFSNTAVINVAGLLASTQAPSLAAIDSIESQLADGATSIDLDVLLSGLDGDGAIQVNDAASLTSTINDITLIGQTISAADTNMDGIDDVSSIDSQGSVNIYANNRSTVTIDLATDVFSVEVTEKLATDPGESLVDMQSSQMIAQVGVNISALSAQALTMNAINTTGIVQADTVSIDADGNVVLGDITAQTSLTAAVSSGDVTDEGRIETASATFTMQDDTEANIILDSADNDIYVFSASGDNINEITLVDTFGMVLDGVEADLFTLTTTGDVQQTNVFNIGDAFIEAAQGDTRFNIFLDLVLDDDTTFNQVGKFGAIGHNVSLIESDGIELTGISATADFILSTDGDIFQTGFIEVLNDSFVFALGNAGDAYDIVLDNDFNELGTFHAVGNNISVVDASGLEFGDVEVANSLFATVLSGDITDTGTVLAPFATFNALDNTSADIVLNSTDNDIGVFAAIGDNINEIFLIDNFGMILDGVEAQLFTLDTTGAVTQTDVLNIGDAFITAADGDVTFDIELDTVFDGGTTFNQIGAFGAIGNNVWLADSDGVLLTGILATEDLFISTDGTITQDGALDVYGESLFVALGDSGSVFNIILEDTANNLGLFSGVGDNISIVDGFGLELGNVEVATSLYAEAISGDITDEGFILAPDATFVAMGESGGSITLDSFDSEIGILSAAGNEIDVVAVDGLVLGDILAQTSFSATVLNGDVTDEGGIDAASATFNMLDETEANIILDSADNDIGSFAAFGAAINEINLVDSMGMVLAGIEANSFMLTTTGDVTQTDFIDVGDAFITAAQGDTRFDILLDLQDLLLNEGSNQVGTFGAVGQNVSVVESGGIELTGISATGDLVVSTSGDITQSRSLEVMNTSQFSATGVAGETFDITLQDNANELGQFSAIGNTIRVTDTNDLVLGDVVASMSMLGSTDGDVSQAAQTAIIAENLALDLQDGATVSLGGANNASSVSIVSSGSLVIDQLNLVADGGGNESVVINADGSMTVNRIDAQSADIVLSALGSVTSYSSGPNSGSGYVAGSNLAVRAAEIIDLHTISSGNNVELIAFGTTGIVIENSVPVTINVTNPILATGAIGFGVVNDATASITAQQAIQSFTVSGEFSEGVNLGLISGTAPSNGVSPSFVLTSDAYSAGLESYATGQQSMDLPASSEVVEAPTGAFETSANAVKLPADQQSDELSRFSIYNSATAAGVGGGR